MAQQHVPILVMIAAMVLVAPNRPILGSSYSGSDALKQLICPRTVASLIANETFYPAPTSASDCDSLGPWRVRCAPYCGTVLQQHIYVYVVISNTCSNIRRVTISTTAFSSTKRVQLAWVEGSGICRGYRPSISDLFVIPGNFCEANAPDLHNLTVTLYDSCDNQDQRCQAKEVRVVRFTEA
ncbi:uncharacterized protein [Haliotis cracherodii]|uniref:uncharacterized protein n=1 Tax=Haliotis cracherodii TaxID=6455 RepID=UPI0039EC4708